MTALAGRGWYLALFLLVGLLHLGQPSPGSAATACTPEDPCEVADGRYLAVPPPDWDARSPLPAVIFFHGWQSTAAAMLANQDLIEPLHEAGHLVILPDGRNKTWAHVGSPSQARDEIAFIRSVLADANQRFPIDPHRLWVSGFSQGGSMVWDLACYLGERFTAFAPVSGAFWEPLPESCEAGPVDLRHIHGTDDQIVPMAGRPIAQHYQQGDVHESMAILREVDRCPEAPSRTTRSGALTCEVWDACESGHELQLCLHDGGHMMPDGWLESTLTWLRSLPTWGAEQ